MAVSYDTTPYFCYIRGRELNCAVAFLVSSHPNHIGIALMSISRILLLSGTNLNDQ